MTYEPPFKVSNRALSNVADIAQVVGRASSRPERLRLVMNREKNIRSIHSSLAIEGNALSVSQVTDVIDGRRVLGPERDVREVRNAWACYSGIGDLDPFSMEDLLSAHGTMMDGIAEDAGSFRKGGVGVFAGDRLIHMSPPADMVPGLVKDLFGWMSRTDAHPLIYSCVFHYEFESIHPFSDGNGRTGRFWQTLILSKWDRAFLGIPVETVVHRRMDEYYGSIEASTEAGESGPFIDFMTSAMRESVLEWEARGTDLGDTVLADIVSGAFVSSAAEADVLGISKPTLDRLLKRLKDEGRIEREGSRKTGRWVALEKREPRSDY